MNPVEKVKGKAIKNTPLLLESKQIDKEVNEYKEKLQTYGIRNSTSKKIEEAFKEEEKKKQEVGKKQAINILVESFAPFAIVTYKTLDEVCNDHKLVIASIRNYDKAIPDENIEEMDSFIDKLKGIDHTTLNKIKVIKNDYFSFEGKANAWGNFVEGYDLVGTEQMFKVAAPKKHFAIPKDAIKVGNEYSATTCDKPKFTLDLKINRPSFELDPIVFIPVKFMGKIFCIVVTAWDKVADDSRILSKL